MKRIKVSSKLPPLIRHSGKVEKLISPEDFGNAIGADMEDHYPPEALVFRLRKKVAWNTDLKVGELFEGVSVDEYLCARRFEEDYNHPFLIMCYWLANNEVEPITSMAKELYKLITFKRYK